MHHPRNPLILALPLVVSALGLPSVAGAQGTAAKTEKTETKNITLVTASSTSDGASEISREKVEDCILSLPDPDKLEALITSEALFVQGLNGVSGRNEWIKSYSARLDVTYMTREKDLIIVTTRSVQGQPPVFREVEKMLRHTQTFVSNSAEGDAFAGRSDRRYYFTSAAAAEKDVKTRARVWISQQSPAVCGAVR